MSAAVSRSAGQAPLRGVRVLELGSTIAGPSAGRHLADLGAEVIKVEQPEGDQLRTWGELAPDGTSWWFKSHNRNKQLLTFDLRKPDDIATVRKIALSCDVVLENFRPGWLEERGLGPRSLREQKPELIFVSISGYGQTGPYASRPGYGNIAEAMGGLRYITGDPDGPPMRVGISIGDELAGLYAVIGVLAALYARSQDGTGDRVDVSLIESTFSLLQATLPEYVHCGRINERTGNRYMRAAPNSVYPTRDGEWLAIGGNSQSIFRRLVTLMGKPELADDPRFVTNQTRAANAKELDALIEAWTRTQDLQAVNAALAEAGVPAGPVMSIEAIAADPQFQARGALASVPDDDGTPVATYGTIPRFTEHPLRLERAAGRIGRDQESVLRELGLSLNGNGNSQTSSATSAAPVPATVPATQEKEAPW
jgi:formyl-CoA transferase